MRRFVVGDIRGDLPLLQKLIDKIGPGGSDVVIFLGSYLGPGPDSRGVVQFVLELGRNLPNTFLFLRGCYEYVFTHCIETKPSWEMAYLWQQMGGNKVFQSYAAKNRLLVMVGGNGSAKTQVAEIPLHIPAEHLRFIEHGLHHWYEDDTFPFVACHSGGHPALWGGKLQVEEQTVFAEKDWWLNKKLRIPGKKILFSHVPFQKPFEKDGKIGIDLGAGIGGKLCAWEAFSESFTIVE